MTHTGASFGSFPGPWEKPAVATGRSPPFTFSDTPPPVFPVSSPFFPSRFGPPTLVLGGATKKPIVVPGSGNPHMRTPGLLLSIWATLKKIPTPPTPDPRFLRYLPPKFLCDPRGPPPMSARRPAPAASRPGESWPRRPRVRGVRAPATPRCVGPAARSGRCLLTTSNLKSNTTSARNLGPQSPGRPVGGPARAPAGNVEPGPMRLKAY